MRDVGLTVGVAVTTRACREAQRLQALGPTSVVALGRLLTTTALTGFVPDRPGGVSLQMISNGRLRQIFADVTDTGALRGYIKPPDLAMPPLTDKQRLGRRTLAHAFGEGVLSVIRVGDDEPFVQSSTDLVSGEIDTDVQHFLRVSDQIDSAVAADVLLADDDTVRLAGGFVAQAMPGSASTSIASIAEALAGDAFAERLAAAGDDPQTLFASVFPNAVLTDPPVPIGWRCRCSYDRVLASLTMLGPSELADMVSREETAVVTCDFCLKQYRVSPEDVRAVYDDTIKGQG
jgi:molecular chaperone Hsp33